MKKSALIKTQTLMRPYGTETRFVYICISSLLMFTVIMFLSLITCRNGELDDIYQIRSGYKLLQIRETDTTHPLSGKQLYASIRETLNEDTDILILIMLMILV